MCAWISRAFARRRGSNCHSAAAKSVTLVAQKVVTYEDRRRRVRWASRLFQGDYFCHPVLLKKRKVPANGRSHFEIVRELYHDPINVRKVSAAGAARRFAHLPAAAAGELADLRHLQRSAVCRSSDHGAGRGDVSPRGFAGGAERTERRPAFGDSAHGAGAGAFLRTGCAQVWRRMRMSSICWGC